MEQEWIRQAQQGSREALNQLIGEYWQSIYRLIVYKTGNREDAQELTQETFVKAVRFLPQYEIRQVPFRSWLERIAGNLVIDFWRKRGRSPSTVDWETQPEPVDARRVGPEQAALRQEQQAELLRLLYLLPTEHRQVVELRIIAGLSVKDTAEQIGKSEGAIKMIQQRALKQLRALCVDQGIWRGEVEP